MSVAEYFARFSRLRTVHPAWRLLAADSAPLILSFLADLFAQTSEVAFSRAKVALDAELIRWKESGLEVQDSAASYLRQWIASGWLREQDDVLLSTSACDVALRFARGLDRRDQSATASHLRVVQDAVRDLAIAMSPDPLDSEALGTGARPILICCSRCLRASSHAINRIGIPNNAARTN